MPGTAYAAVLIDIVVAVFPAAFAAFVALGTAAIKALVETVCTGLGGSRSNIVDVDIGMDVGVRVRVGVGLG